MSPAKKILTIAVILSATWACSAVVEPGTAMSGIYSLEHVDGPALVQGVGTLVFSRQGYAERRIRYRNPDGSLSQEYLSRGDASLLPDSTIQVVFRDMNPVSEFPWEPKVRLTATGVELVRHGAYDGTRIVETYRKQQLSSDPR